MEIQTSKTLGGIGAILMFIMPFLGGYGGILGIIGLILVLVAMKGFADTYSEQGIFNNALYGIIAAIVGGVITVAIIFWGLVDFFTTLGIDIANWMDPTIISRIDWTELMNFSILTNFLMYIAAAVIVLFVFFIITAIFLRKSLSLLSAKSGVGLFGTTGLLILIGAVLTIIAIGLLLIWIAFILLAVAFFSIKATPRSAAPPPSTQ
jgi:uncharacterized membrane protein